MAAFTGTFAGDVFTVAAGDNRYDALSGNDTAIFDFKLTDAVFSYSGNEVIVDTAMSHTVLTGFQTYRFTDGTVEENDGNPLVADLSYYANNHDVWTAQVDADGHYASSGWREGRDPSAFFDTSYYLSSNPDVAQSGVNPLVHYDQYGWNEGRAPSLVFDQQAYLINNPAVAAAGVNPLAHFLSFGGEGEAAQAAAVSSSVNSAGFDSAYYLNTYPDVAAGGSDPYQHFLIFGWKEGRDPNAFFDTSGYLATYPDVAAGGTNPLDHYNASGWHEGRNPSPGFDTIKYLDNYPDVAASGVNPLIHFLTFGIDEGRTAFPEDLSDVNGVVGGAVIENAANGSDVGIKASWGGWAEVSFSITSDPSGAFTINTATGVVTVANGALLDFESTTEHFITVKATDGALNHTQAFKITVTDNVADNNTDIPVITSDGGGATATSSVAENTIAVTTVVAVDSDGPTLTYSIVGGADAAEFTINSSNGALSFVAAPNFEAPTDVGIDNSYIVQVQASDGTFSDTQTITVNVTNVNDAAPVNTVPGAQVATEDTALPIAGVSVADVDSTVSVTLSVLNGVLNVTGGGVTGSGTNSVTIASASSAAINAILSTLTYQGNLNFNGGDTLTIVSSDGAGIDTDTIAITVNPVNDAPQMESDSFSVTENAATDPVGNLLGGDGAGPVNDSDVDGPALVVTQFTIISGGPAGPHPANGTPVALGNGATLAIDADGDVHLSQGTAYDYLGTGENAQIILSYDVQDGGTPNLTDGEGAVITINGVNVAPTLTLGSAAVLLEIASSSQVGVAIADAALASVTDEEQKIKTIEVDISDGFQDGTATTLERAQLSAVGQFGLGLLGGTANFVDNGGNGTLTLSFATPITAAQATALLKQVDYVNQYGDFALAIALDDTRTISVRVQDHNDEWSTTQSRTVNIAADVVDAAGLNGTFVGGDFADTINGADGNDTITGGAGDDILIGGTDTTGDTVNYAKETDAGLVGTPVGTNGVIVNLSGTGYDLDGLDPIYNNTPDNDETILAGQAIDTYDNHDTLNGIENVVGTSRDDIIVDAAMVSNNYAGGEGTETGGDTVVFRGNFGGTGDHFRFGPPPVTDGDDFTVQYVNNDGTTIYATDTLTDIENLVFDNVTLDTLPVWLLDTAGSLVSMFTNLESAVNASQDGYTVRMFAGAINLEDPATPGTNDGKVFVNTNITIEGAGLGSTTLQAVTDIANAQLSSYAAMITVNPGKAVTFRDFTIDGGDSAGVDVATGILFAGGQGTVDTVRFQNIGADVGPEPRGAGINAWDELVDSSLRTINVIDSQFADLERKGVAVFDTNTTLNVSGATTFTGRSSDDASFTEWVDYGVQVSDGALANITGATFSGFAATQGGATSAAVLVAPVFQPALASTANLFGNTFTNNLVSVAVGFNTTDVDMVNFNTSGLFPTNTSNSTVPGALGLLANGDVVVTGVPANLSGTAVTVDWTGGPNANAIFGDDQNDQLIGNGGADTFTGGGGNDAIEGGSDASIDEANGYAGTGWQIRINGSGNWVVENTISGEVDTLTDIEKVVIGGTTYLLVDQETDGGFSSVQAAIDAASGATTILIAPGTYTETSAGVGGGDPQGLYIDKPDLTLQGVTTTGVPIASGALAETAGPTIVAGQQNQFGANHWVDVGGDSTTFSGVHLQAGAETNNKLLEIWADDVTVENSFVDVYAGGTTYTFAVAIYLNDNGTTASDEISSYTIDGNILNEGIIVANGVGDPSSHTFGATQLITDNRFEGTFDYLTGEGRYDTIVLNGQVTGIGWLLEPTQIPTISGNTFENNTTPFLLRGSDDDVTNLPTTAQVEQILAANGDTNLTYAYVTMPNGDLRTDDFNAGASHRFAVTNTIDTLNLALDTSTYNNNPAFDQVFPDQRIYMQSGDTVHVQSAGGTVNSQIMVDNLTVQATSNSTDLNLTLATLFADGSAISGGGVTTVTLADYATGLGANVDVTGNVLGNTVTGNSGNNTINTLGGDDTINYTAGDGVDTVDGGEGSETLVGDTLTINATDDDDYIAVSPTLDLDTPTEHLDVDIDAGSATAVNDAIELDVINVEEIVINTGAGNDTVVVSGDLGGTGVSQNTVTLNGGAGDDTLDASGLTGTPVRVVFNGGEGNDILKGGGNTADSAVYADDVDGYNVTVAPDGTVTVEDIAFDGIPGNGDNEGTDTLSGIETLNFNGTSIDLTANVLVYDGAYPGTGPGTLKATYSTIQDAIDGLSTGDGDTIVVRAGSYTGTLNITKELTFLGAQHGNDGDAIGRGTGESILSWSSGNVTNITDPADAVTFSGFEFSGNDVITQSSAGASVTLQDSRFFINVPSGTGTGFNAFYLSDAANFTFKDNLVDVTGYASALFQPIGNTTTMPITITGNAFVGHAGIYAAGDDNNVPVILNLSGVSGLVDDNTFTNVDIGVLVADDTGGLTISNNQFEDMHRVLGQTAGGNAAGIVFYQPAFSGPITIFHNTFENADAGIRTSGTPGASVVGLTINIDENTFTNVSNELLQPAQGTLRLTDSTVNGDAVLPVSIPSWFFGGNTGDTITGMAGFDLIQGNDGDDTITGNGGADTIHGGTGSDVARFSGNQGDYTITWNGTTATVQDNRGGSPDGTDTIDSVGELRFVDHSMWLVQGAGSDFTTIQAAVDVASDGDTILVAAGTYAEQVLVNGKDLTLTGLSGAIIQAPATITPSFTISSSSTPNKFALIGVENGAHVTIDNFDLDGQGRGDQANGGDFAGVYFWNADGQFINSSVTGIRNGGPLGTLDGIQHGNAVVAFMTDLSPHTVEVANNTITDFQKSGIFFNGTGLIANIHDNQITGAGNTLVIGQNGIQVSRGATGSVDNNTISGIDYGNPSVNIAVGVLVFQSANVTVNGNTVNGDTGDGDAGVYFLDSDGGAAHNNILNDVGFGVIDLGVFTTPVAHQTLGVDDNTFNPTDANDINYGFYPSTSSTTNYTFSGSSGVDDLEGAAGDDTLSGLGGDDLIIGNGGSDTLFGDDGTDTLNGGVNDFSVTPVAANDVLWGGADTDTFRFEGRFGADAIGAVGTPDWTDGEDLVFVGYASETPVILDVAGGALITVDDGLVSSSVFVAGALSSQMQVLISGGDLIIH